MSISATFRQAPREIAADFAPSQLFETISYGVVVGVMNIISSVSLMALVFQGDLAYALPVGIGIGLSCSLITGIVTAITSSFRGMVAGVQDSTTAVAGVAAASIATQVTGETQIPTVIALLFTISTLTSGLLLVAGRLRLGGFVRFIPHPVIGGFQVASGVLILSGAVSIILPDGLEPAFQADSIALWLPAVILGVSFYLLTIPEKTRGLIPLVVVGSIGVAQLLRVLGGLSVTDARERGWLYNASINSDSWSPDVILTIVDADWVAVARQSAAIGTVAVLTLLAVLIKTHALDTATGADIDVDQELEVSGWSMLASLPTGGPPAYLFFGYSLLIRKLSGPRRGAALLSILFLAVALLAGSTVLTIVPTLIIGALLIYQGLDFMMIWVWDSRKTLDRLEYLLVVSSGIAVLLFGFLWAIALGTVAAIALFVFRYSRIDAIRHAYTLQEFRSGIERSPAESLALEERGHRASVFELDGYLFFGTAYSVFTDPRIVSPDQPMSHAIFDVDGVTGIDSSASVAVAKLVRSASERELVIHLAGPDHIVSDLVSQVAVGTESLMVHANLDDAVAACEEAFLAPFDFRGDGPPMLENLFSSMVGPERSEQVMAAFNRRDFMAGDVVVQIGAEAPGLFFLQSGALTAQLPSSSGPTIKLRTMLPATVLGEISLYNGGESTAEVVAAEDSTVLHLSPRELSELEESDPTLAAAIHRVAAQTLAGRLLHAERALRTLRS